MPPVEALMLNVPVVTTRAGAIEETTMGLAIYVDNPTDEREWLEKIVHEVPKFNAVNSSRLRVSEILVSYHWETMKEDKMGF